MKKLPTNAECTLGLRRDAPFWWTRRLPQPNAALAILATFFSRHALAPNRRTPGFIFRRMDAETTYIYFRINKSDAVLLQKAYPAPRSARAARAARPPRSALPARSQKPQIFNSVWNNYCFFNSYLHYAWQEEDCIGRRACFREPLLLHFSYHV